MAASAPREADLARAYYERYLLPSLRPHQRVAAVPGLFGDAASSRNATDAALTAKLRGYANWSDHEPRLVGLAPWHWDNLLADKALPARYRLGACAYPLLLREVAAWRKRLPTAVAARSPSLLP